MFEDRTERRVGDVEEAIDVRSGRQLGEDLRAHIAPRARPRGDTARVIVYTGGPLAGQQRILQPFQRAWFVDCFDPMRDDGDIGLGVGAYQVIEVGDGIARTIWHDSWERFLAALDEVERRHGFA
jgi:hypothetical protein